MRSEPEENRMHSLVLSFAHFSALHHELMNSLGKGFCRDVCDESPLVGFAAMREAKVRSKIFAIESDLPKSFETVQSDSR